MVYKVSMAMVMAFACSDEYLHIMMTTCESSKRIHLFVHYMRLYAYMKP